MCSAYLDLIGEDMGLLGIAAAKGDRFLPQAQSEVVRAGMGMGDRNGTLVCIVSLLSVVDMVDGIVADVNNQVR